MHVGRLTARAVPACSPATSQPSWQGVGASMASREPRSSWSALWLLPLAIPLLWLVARVLLVVVRVLTTVTFEVGEALLGTWVGWALSLTLCAVLLKRLLNRRKPQAVGEPAPPPAAASPLLDLVSKTQAWLAEQASALPPDAQRPLDAMHTQLVAIASQLRERPPEAQLCEELTSLLGSELPQLIERYRSVPSGLRQRSVQGRSSAEEQLCAGLSTLDAQLTTLHERLAAEALQALAIHQRYLDLKYKS